MGVKNYLIEGVSGTGKTTVAEELQRCGYHVIHGDRELAYVGDPETGKPLNGPPEGITDSLGWGHEHWIWPVDKVKALIADQRHAISFFCGGSRNFSRFIGLFDAVFVLEVDLDTLKRRLVERPHDEFGGKPDERAFIARLHATGEDIPTGGITIDATSPLTIVVDEILAHLSVARPLANAVGGMPHSGMTLNSLNEPTRAFTKLSLKWSMIEEPTLSILDKFLLLADLGYDGVELDAPNELPVAEVLAARDRSGLAIPGVINSMHWKAPLTDPDAAVRQIGVEAIRTALTNAREYGASTVLVVPGVVNAQTSYSQAYTMAQAELRKVLDHAETTGVSIAIENVWNDFLLSPLEAARFVDELGSARVGWYFDVGNVLRYGRPAHWTEALGKRILKVDIKEFSLTRMNAEGPWKGFEVELGEGDCDWASVNSALLASGYSGWGSIEMPGGDRHRLKALKDGADRIAAL